MLRTALMTEHTCKLPMLSPRRDGGGKLLHRAVTCGFIVVHVDPLQLEVAVPVVAAGGIDAVLITDDLPELQRPPERQGRHRGPAPLDHRPATQRVESRSRSTVLGCGTDSPGPRSPRRRRRAELLPRTPTSEPRHARTTEPPQPDRELPARRSRAEPLVPEDVGTL